MVLICFVFLKSSCYLLYPLFLQDPTTKELTDFVSFYNLPSSVVNHPVHKTLKACYSFYNISGKTPFKELLYDALVLSKKVTHKQ